MSKPIVVRDATEKNLAHVTLEIPRNQLVVFTGVSGSGKSTLAVDVIFNECQRQYLEAIGMQGIRKPALEKLEHASPAVMISQTDTNRNPRSTVGTVTDIYTDLRMIYEKLAVRHCPHCEREVSAADCPERIVKHNGSWMVYMTCVHCGEEMEKLTRTHYSHNTSQGACPVCEGLGEVVSLAKGRILDERLSLEDGAVDYWTHQYKAYQITAVYQAMAHYGVPVAPGTPVADYSEVQRTILCEGTDSEAVKLAFPDHQPPKTVASGKFEGVYTTLWRRIAEKGSEAMQHKGYIETKGCPSCNGERLTPLSREATVAGARLPELSALSLEKLLRWSDELHERIGGSIAPSIKPYLVDMHTKLHRLGRVGLGYLTLDRQTITLSGGELQRVRLAAALDSELTGIIYILDEPTAGLHPQDTAGIVELLVRLRDVGNTVLVIEHDPEMMRQADHIIDVGPGAGLYGGTIIGQGSWDELLSQESSVTGRYLSQPAPPLREPRTPGASWIEMKRVSRYNLHQLDVRFPTRCLTVVTGVSGSGKSTLVFDVLANVHAQPQHGEMTISGMDGLNRMAVIEQTPLTRMKRSNVATYSNIYGAIRKLFGSLEAAKMRKLSASHFSFNSAGGRCERCEGLGVVSSSMLFFQDVEVVCPACGGDRFMAEVLEVKYNGRSIKDVLALSITEAAELFAGHARMASKLRLLLEVGLGYLTLGQTLTTLSGGEGQRLKLAKELIEHAGKPGLYLMDEPTAGLHPLDVDHFLVLLHRLVEAGSTVIVVEHNQQVIEAADWIIDLGPGGGDQGGKLMFAGTPQQMLRDSGSPTAESMRKQQWTKSSLNTLR
ncbi:excinuclease ABC subunit A [Paenibacillus sp. 598K]|uniref:ATP-binding cassette domain-containing protein n=1 Tax=Paenibacillus sp. 598K TaxID=1117987 RepID=UPI000FF9F2CF|nr:excinuclease ABC subunit UvrA [Paenibacillus sp. 598K]GBF75909.1 excinuclease ABC subunit A [Paenibacillus sp. 598K]